MVGGGAGGRQWCRRAVVVEVVEAVEVVNGGNSVKVRV
jgi:hypothetical protein